MQLRKRQRPAQEPSPRKDNAAANDDTRAGSVRRQDDTDVTQGDTINQAPARRSREWYSDLWYVLIAGLDSVPLARKQGISRGRKEATTWYRARSFASIGRDVRERVPRWWSNDRDAVDEYRAMWLTHCPWLCDECDVARALKDAVEERLRPEPLPRRDTGMVAARLQLADGAAEQNDAGEIYYAETGRRVDRSALNAYVASQTVDRERVAAYAHFCEHAPDGEVSRTMWDRVVEGFKLMRVEADEIRGARFFDLEADLAAAEARLAKRCRQNCAVLPYEEEPEGEISWFGHENFWARPHLDAYLQSDAGAVGRGAYTGKRKDNIREFFKKRGVLKDFVYRKFPSLKEEFDKSKELLELFEGLVQIDHIISSGGDFRENFWFEFNGINQFFLDVRAMPLKRTRVGAYVWRRVVAVFNRISAAEEGVHKFIE